MSQHPSLDDSAFEPLQNLHQAVESLSFPSYPLCIVTRLQRHGSDDSSKGKDREGEIEWVVAAGLVLEGGKREQWWSRVFTRDELERSAEIPNSAVYGKELFVRLRAAWLRGGLQVYGLASEKDFKKSIEIQVGITPTLSPRFPLDPCDAPPFSLLTLLSKTIPSSLVAESASAARAAAVAQFESLRKTVDTLRASNAVLKEQVAQSKKIGRSASQKSKDASPKKEGIPGVTKRVKVTARPGIVVKKRDNEFDDPSDSD